MARQKVYTYFNKNHITIQRIENPEYFDLTDGEATYEEQITSNRTEIWANNWWDPGTKTVEKVKKVSPLGFYYYVTKEIVKYRNNRYRENVRGQYIVSYRLGNNKYILKFLTRWDDAEVRRTEDSIRPWEVCPDDKGFSDNMLNSLVSDLNDFFDRMRTTGIDKVCRSSDRKFPGYRAYNVSEMQIEVNELMFGNRKGLRFQTDKEKIESHGFDTKYSFRKDKETK
jgi:hypothetical protein